MTKKVDFDAIKQLVEQDNVLELARLTPQVVAQAQSADINGRGLLHAAVHYKAGDSLQWLLDLHKFNVDLADNQGETPLMRASWLGYKPAVEMLLEAGAQLEKASLAGGTALHFAYAGGTPAKEVVQTLLTAGASPAALDKSGNDPESWTAQAVAREEGARLLANETASRGKLSMGRKSA